MTIKYNVLGAKARNGAVIQPMDFDNKRVAERFANYHEGLTVKQNLRKCPGKVQAVSYDVEDFAPTAEDNAAAKVFFGKVKPLSELIASSEPFRVDYPNGQSFGRVHRHQFTEGTAPVQSIVNVKVLTDGIDEHTGPTRILPLPPVQAAPVGNPVNEDLKAAYEMGYKQAVGNSFWKCCRDEDVESQDYADQRRSDLKELISFDRNIN